MGHKMNNNAVLDHLEVTLEVIIRAKESQKLPEYTNKN
jgi:hypothetical protein